MKKIIPTLLLLILGIVFVFFYKGGKTASSFGSVSLGQRALEHTNVILSYGPRPPGSEGLDKVNTYVSEQLRSFGWTVSEQQFSRFTPKGRMGFTNVIARFQQDANSNDAIELVLGAHIDSKAIEEFTFLGADDAASAVGALLVLAEKLKDDPIRARQTEIVFFDGEEALGREMTNKDGLYGSRYYASFWRSEKKKPAHGILLDMIGHKNLDIKIPSDSPKRLATLLMECAKAEGVSEHFGKLSYPIIDDHVPINNAGIPMIDIIGDFGTFDWWHKKGDDGSNLSSESLDISLRVVDRMITGLLTAKKTSEK